MSALTVNYCGERYVVEPSDEFTFGRAGELSIDENPYLHRVMGQCFWRSGWWWLANAGASLPLHLQGQIGGTAITLSPGGSIPLVMGPTTVRFAAGGTSYEVDLLVTLDESTLVSKRTLPGDSTIDAGETPLTSEQFLLLVALAETRLRRGKLADLPTNAELMGRFGWSYTKFNRKLDSLCAKFARRGVSDLVGSLDRMAQGRRSVLVDHVIASGMITVDQLSLLPPRGGDRSP